MNPYIEARIRRPPCRHVVPGSTPVISFGDFQRATVATIGLNPSRVEFFENGSELVGNARRLATHTSLGTTNLAEAPIETIARVLDDCNAYFQRNPYRRWFDQLAPVLSACKASYYDGSACHLDLVQWSTDPTWRHLDAATRRRLIADDADFLAEQLQSENLRLLLVNGAGVIRQLQRTLADNLTEVDRITGLARQPARLYAGQINHFVVIGWSTNLQSSWGVTTELRQALATRIAQLV